MKNDAALLFAEAAASDKWENEDRGSYDVETLHQEYRKCLFSEKALILMSAQSDKPSK